MTKKSIVTWGDLGLSTGWVDGERVFEIMFREEGGQTWQVFQIPMDLLPTMAQMMTSVYLRSKMDADNPPSKTVH